MTQRTVQTAKPSKQRKMLFQAPDRIRYKHFAALLSSELRKSYGTRNLPVRSGDTVRIMRGDRKGFEGKVTRMDREKYRIYVEGLTREKVDGTTIFIPVHPSKVMITKLNLDDKWRKKILNRRKKGIVSEEVLEKPSEEKPKRKRKTVKQPKGEKTEEKQKTKTQKKPEKQKVKEEAELG